LLQRNEAMLWIFGGTLVDLIAVIIVATAALGALFWVLWSSQPPPRTFDEFSADIILAEANPSFLDPPELATAATARPTIPRIIRSPEENAESIPPITMPRVEPQARRSARSARHGVAPRRHDATAKLNHAELRRILQSRR
jgi:hypothetical protein